MPIQFRCGSCQQLLGIARRKAGAIVNCPTCREKTRVPIIKENVAPPPPTKAAVNQPVSIFDRVDVEKLLSPHVNPPALVKGKLVHQAVAEIELPSLMTEPTPDPLQNVDSSSIKKEPVNGVKDHSSDDEPFTLTSAPLPSEGFLVRNRWRIGLGLVGLLLIAGVFVLGHWLGARQPLF